jgi:hypothetical protein
MEDLKESSDILLIMFSGNLFQSVIVTYPRLSKEELEHNLSIHERASIQVPSQTTTRVCLLCMGPRGYVGFLSYVVYV